MKAIEVKQLTKRFGTFTAVDHISFEVEPARYSASSGQTGQGRPPPCVCSAACRSRHPARPG